jgi:hypothetical protein
VSPTARERADNAKALGFDGHLGFREVHRVKDGHSAGVDTCFFEMRREECRWILGDSWAEVNPTLNQKDRQASGKAPAASGKNSSQPRTSTRAARRTSRRAPTAHQNGGRTAPAAYKNPDGTWTQNTSFNPTLHGRTTAAKQPGGGLARQAHPNGSAARDQAIQGAYSQAKSRLDPRFEQEGNQLASQLAAQGLDPNSQAYRTAMENYGQLQE